MSSFINAPVANVGIAETTIFTASAGVKAILIGCNLANKTGGILPISIWVRRSGGDFFVVKGKRVGTVLGFHYPDVEKRLGTDFVRDDAPSSPLSLRKWQLGRSDYVIAPRGAVDKMIANGELLVHARDSLQRSFSGFAIGSLLGIALGAQGGHHQSLGFAPGEKG